MEAYEFFDAGEIEVSSHKFCLLKSIKVNTYGSFTTSPGSYHERRVRFTATNCSFNQIVHMIPLLSVVTERHVILHYFQL